MPIIIHMHANWCFQSKCSNISAEGLHFSAFIIYVVAVCACVASNNSHLVKPSIFAIIILYYSAAKK